jgi:nucleoid-associated protein YgaU
MFGSHLTANTCSVQDTGVNRTRVRRRRVVLALAAGALTTGILAQMGSASGRPDRPAPIVRYVVQDGDTLWAIAGSVRPGRDPRATIDAIADANGIDAGAIVPGQSLVIPAQA